MDYAACNVVYVDRSAQEDKLVKRDDATSLASSDSTTNHAFGNSQLRRTSPVEDNLRTLLGTFSEVHICTSGKSCISKLSELNQASIVELIPTLVLVDIPHEDQYYERPSRDARTPSPTSQQVGSLYGEEIQGEAYGVSLLQWIASEIQYQSLSRLVVPVAVVASPEHHALAVRTTRGRTDSRGEVQFSFSLPKKRAGLITPLDQARTMRYLDVGAVDVLTSPLLQDRLPSLAIHAYRAHKDASKEQRALLEMKRGRKRSWVGVDDQKPYAYLREAMVSGLMDNICRLGDDNEPFGPSRMNIAWERRDKIAAAVGSWDFSAHEFTDDELLHAALLMLQHALAMPQLEKWRISTENLTGFLFASRSAYNAFVPYHNFRHVVDVLQATFHFLVQLGRLPQYPTSSRSSSQEPPCPIAELIRPFDALTLLITAIGHDVGHPGVNNAFLVTLNAPLAQLYNDRSVLESFHCAAYSQILRRHWPAAFAGVEMRQLMISSILATDMGLHFDYMKRLGWMQEKLHGNGGTDGWNGRILDDQRTLACSLLIKCADISNVARTYDVAAQWTMILTDEFARQASMEQDLGIPSALFAAPVREIVELGKSQIGFMNMFAIPLFAGVTDVMPAMAFCVEELNRNKAAWEDRIKDEQRRVRQDSGDSILKDGMFSPRTMSVADPLGAPPAIHGRIASPPTLTDADLRKALLSKSPFSPTNGTLDESEQNLISLPMITTHSPASPSSDHPSPSELLPLLGEGGTRPLEKKPTQLQLTLATTSTVDGSPDHSTGSSSHNSSTRDSQLTNGTASTVNGSPLEPSRVTEPLVALDPTPPMELRQGRDREKEIETEIEKEEKAKQRSSDGTEGSNNSAVGDWTSQATSATTGKMPLSPSTQGTSIMSKDSLEKNGSVITPTRNSPCVSRCSDRVGISSRGSDMDRVVDSNRGRGGMGGLMVEGRGAGAGGAGNDAKSPGTTVIMERVRGLKKKPSRFRMNFWKRSKSASPPVPRGGSEEASIGNGNGNLGQRRASPI